MPPKKSSLNKKTKNALVLQSLRIQETPQEYEVRLSNARDRASTSRATETLEHYNVRLETQGVLASTSRTNESSIRQNERLSSQQSRSSRLRAEETAEQRQVRRRSQQIRSSKSRAQETPEQRQVRLRSQQSRSLTLRDHETPEQHEIRVSNQYDRTTSSRSNATTDQHDQRLRSQRSRSSSLRSNESSSERESRLRDGRLRVVNTRSNETPNERERRLRNERSRIAQRRSNETLEERDAHRNYNQRRFQNHLNVYERIAFNYNSNVDYSDDELVSIGEMNNVCKHCNALKYKNEPPGICCSNGKIVLPELRSPPEPLFSLMSGTTSESKHFLSNIRKYNSCFQMTSFGATKVVKDNFLPTFRVQGQIYHRMGSLLPIKDHKFLQIYFMGQADDIDQVQQRRQYNPATRERIVAELQKMLHENNELVRTFKKANNDLQLLPNHQVVIHADKVPVGEHQGRYNAPTANDVAVLMVGDPVAHRDIIVRRFDDRVNRISETHRSYDALQYPIIFPYGDDGYHFEIRQINPATSK
ncbi:uncharacterized protein [Musca autumnalis]|uniref:uncharacterized protein n=1 Tax=Musca autumnalis TaxID=221902 RepID=UPI003CE79E0F